MRGSGERKKTPKPVTAPDPSKAFRIRSSKGQKENFIHPCSAITVPEMMLKKDQVEERQLRRAR